MERCLPEAIISRDMALRVKLERAKETLKEAYKDIRDYNESMVELLNRKYNDWIGKNVTINVLTSIGEMDFHGVLKGFECREPYKSTTGITYVKFILMEPNKNGTMSTREAWTPNLDLEMLSTLTIEENRMITPSV